MGDTKIVFQSDYTIDVCQVHLYLYHCDEEYFHKHSCLIEMGEVGSYIMLITGKADDGEVGSHSVGLSMDVILSKPMVFASMDIAKMHFDTVDSQIREGNTGSIRVCILKERMRLNGSTYPTDVEKDIGRLNQRWPGIYTKYNVKLLQEGVQLLQEGVL